MFLLVQASKVESMPARRDASMNQCFFTAGLYGDIVGHSDFQVNLRPPGIGFGLICVALLLLF